MGDRIEDAARKKTLAARYAERVDERRQKLKSKLTPAQYALVKQDWLGEDIPIRNDLLKAMKDPDTVPSEYLTRKMGWLFEDAIPGSEKEVVLYFADRLREYPYSDSYVRRSFRAKSGGAYVLKLVNLIRSYATIETDPTEAPLYKILNRELPEEISAYLDVYSWNGCGYTAWQVAYALDRHDTEVEDAVTRILTEENGSGRMTAALIGGIVISHRSEFHELLGKLLLAAKLQEGLRQSICENADRGTKEAFLTLLKVIDENRLIRYSSVKRAVGTWLGLIAEDTHDLERVSDKSVRLIIDCLENMPLREEYLASGDAMKIYIALWSYGFDGIEDAGDQILSCAESGTEHQLLVSGYFSENLDLPRMSNLLAKKVLERHSAEEKILAVWLPSFMKTHGDAMWNAARSDARLDLNEWFDDRAELDGFYQRFKELYHAFAGKEKTFSPCVFPWYGVKLEKSALAEILCTLAALSGERGLMEEACAYIRDCDTMHRQTCFTLLLRDPRSALQRKTVLEGLADKETSTRNAAFEIASKLRLTEDEYRLIEGYLRFKGADIRKNVIALLLKQEDDALTACVSDLLRSGKEEIRLGGLDMITQLKKDPDRAAVTEGFSSLLKERAKAPDLSSKEKLLLDVLLPAEVEKEEKPLYTADDRYAPTEFDADYLVLCAKTFEDYFPDSALPGLILGKQKDGGLFGKIKSAISEGIACASSVQACADLMSLSDFIDRHRTDPFPTSYGETVLVGDVRFEYHFRGKNGELPLAELWQTWFRDNGVTGKRLLRALIMFRAYQKKTVYSKECAAYVRTVFGPGFEVGKALPYAAVMGRILTCGLASLPGEETTRLCAAILHWFCRCVPDDRVMIKSPSDPPMPGKPEKAHLLAHPQLSAICCLMKIGNDAELKNVFPLSAVAASRCDEAYDRLPKQVYKGTGPFCVMPEKPSGALIDPESGMFYKDKTLVGINAYLYAAYQGVITEAETYEYLLRPRNLSDSLRVVTAVTSAYTEKGRQVSGRENYLNYQNKKMIRDFLGKEGEPIGEDLELISFVTRVYGTLIPVVLSSELSRGDSPAEYSGGIHGIVRVYGADVFARILTALGNDTLDRSAAGGWGNTLDRRHSLSTLLSVCIPAENDTEETLRAALDGKMIGKKRLIEAAMFSPEWIPIVGRYLGIDAFESVCYYFMAHMNEKFDDKRRAIIARYTPLTEEELNLGAFDRGWFRSAYDAVGEKDFNFIYDAAKYVTDGAKHSRARKYADAALGRTDAEETRKTVAEKRNKDLLMAYALIPLDGEDDLCRRYLFIQQFRKESRGFGSQRAANEAKAADMALLNLALNAGYSDPLRLTLRMEIKVIDDSRALLEEQTVEGVSVRVTVDEGGKASILCQKDGKTLKNVPEKLKKNETVKAMTEFVRTLTEQYRRTRLMLENAMEDSSVFPFGELGALSAHPVVEPMLKTLVMISGGTVGFLTEDGLAAADGTVQPLDAEAPVRIAHPLDLYRNGSWRAYQAYLYDRRITQPFRQVFRELYIKTEDETEAFHSLRYAGNQIQPAKTAAVLKSRRWVADVENGLQKIYYRENVVAQIYALADWFSPADIEAPTLEWVCFSDRRTGKELRISEVPDLLFSEVMRDVDLAVSTAHAGGVDPETSHSTVEMRAAILSFVLPMFRLMNVMVEGSHAIVSGKRGEYSVHLGSGVVHQIGGAMIPVLPVHSQHRGRIFLPFVDEDPKTAEILSKVLLFAEDEKIKDPMILSCIGNI